MAVAVSNLEPAAFRAEASLLGRFEPHFQGGIHNVATSHSAAAHGFHLCDLINHLKS